MADSGIYLEPKPEFDDGPRPSDDGPRPSLNHRHYKGTVQHRTIRSLKNVPLDHTVQLRHNRLTTNIGSELVFPAEGGRVLTEGTSAASKSLNQLVDYLKSWAEAGNMEMDDVREFIDTEDGTERIILKCVGKFPENGATHFVYEVEYVPKGFKFINLIDNRGEEVLIHRTVSGFAFTIEPENTEFFVDCKARFVSFVKGAINPKGVPDKAPRPKFMTEGVVNQEVLLTLPSPEKISVGDRFAVGAKTKTLFTLKLLNHYVEEGIGESDLTNLESSGLKSAPRIRNEPHIALDFELSFAMDQYPPPALKIPFLILHPEAKQIVEYVWRRYVRDQMQNVIEGGKIADDGDEQPDLEQTLFEAIMDVMVCDMDIPEWVARSSIIPCRRTDDTHLTLGFNCPTMQMNLLPSTGRFLFIDEMVGCVGTLAIPTNPLPHIDEKFYFAIMDIVTVPRTPVPRTPFFPDEQFAIPWDGGRAFESDFTRRLKATLKPVEETTTSEQK